MVQGQEAAKSMERHRWLVLPREEMEWMEGKQTELEDDPTGQFGEVLAHGEHSLSFQRILREPSSW